MRAGTLLGRGRSADVYAVAGDDTRVLRRYRDGADARGEAALMAELAAAGYPVPAVHPGAAPAFTDLVLERIEGPTLLAALGSGAASPAEAGARRAADPGLANGEHAAVGEALALVARLRWPDVAGEAAAGLSS
ncbi:hypothetical protein D7319_19185 [Streptomyces radicis]|uniref:Uncharacterized protein n=1 Tax=Streptomyces radicis TaxID=1750517 RepID=A0A3A9WHY9_9ACTN|nr:hypothetical protein D7319_19185 [Streptomyces radicis]RKN26870.1 hypothetical protein D7318_05365 [Streptomyces radicis]